MVDLLKAVVSASAPNHSHLSKGACFDNLRSYRFQSSLQVPKLIGAAKP